MPNVQMTNVHHGLWNTFLMWSSKEHKIQNTRKIQRRSFPLPIPNYLLWPNVIIFLQALSSCISESWVLAIASLVNYEFKKAYLDNLVKCSVLNIKYGVSLGSIFLMICRKLKAWIVVLSLFLQYSWCLI